MNFDLINLSLLIVVLIFSWLAWTIYSKGKNKRISNLYLFVIFSIIFWTIGMMLFRGSPPEFSLFFCVVLYVLATFTASTFLVFSFVFPNGGNIKKISKFLIICLNFFIILLTAYPGIIIKEVLAGDTEKIIVWGDYYFLYFFYISGFFSFGLVVLFFKFLKEKRTTKNQILYVFLGYLIGSSLAMTSNLLLPWLGIYKFNWFGQIASIIMVAFTTYAIIRHHLMNIKFALRKSSVTVLAFLTVFALFWVVRYFFYYDFLPRELKFLLDFSFLAIILFIYPRLTGFYYKIANKYFFSSLYDGNSLMARVSEELRSTLDLRQIYNIINKDLQSALHYGEFAVFLTKGKNSCYLKYNQGFKLGRKKKFNFKNIFKNILRKDKPVLMEELSEDIFKKEFVLKKFKKDGAAVLVPLNTKEDTIGFIILGPKDSGDAYDREDLRVLDLIAGQISFAIDNALLYEEKLNFNIKLEQEIKKATHELRVANKRLTRLDRAKSEFISIASHQLRTPLTVIKGYISMLLDENFGRVVKKQKDPLVKVGLSADRLINLVENLLNISRIESGKIQFRFANSKINEITDSVVEELGRKAEEKGLKIVYKKTGSFPILQLDEEKIRQVVLNLIDNAIKYTKEGKIYVDLQKEKGKISFCVKDNGMGIGADDLPELFKKFSRGKGTSVVHTEGTGLGLYVAKNMIDAHKGKIWAESKGENKGARFCFELYPAKLKKSKS